MIMKASQGCGEMRIRMMIAVQSLIVAEGLRSLLDGDPYIEVTGLLPKAPALAGGTGRLRPEVTLTDILTLYNAIGDDAEGACGRLILLDTGCSRELLVSSVIEKGLSGVLSCEAAATSLNGAVMEVARGGVWFEDGLAGEILAGLTAQRKPGKPALTEAEGRGISLLSMGCGDRELAQRLGMEEPAIRSMLKGVMDKLGLRGRAELASYAHRDRGAVLLSLLQRTG